MFHEMRLASSVGSGRLVRPSGVQFNQASTKATLNRNRSRSTWNSTKPLFPLSFSLPAVSAPVLCRFFLSYPEYQGDYNRYPDLPFRSRPLQPITHSYDSVGYVLRLVSQLRARLRIFETRSVCSKRSYMITHLEQQPALSPGSLTSILPSGAREPNAPEPDG